MKINKLLILNFLGLLFTTSISAQQWNSMPKLFVGSDTVTSVFEIDNYGTNIYFSTNKGLFKSADNGNNWSNLTWTNGVAASQIITNTFVDTSNNDIYVSSDSSIYKSTDNGASWATTAINNNLKNINAINKLGPNIVIAYGPNLTGGIKLSSDGLNSVQTATIANLGMRDILDMPSADFVAGMNGAYKSTDNGLTWVLSGTGHPVGGKYGKIINVGNRLLAADIFGKGVYKSDDNGNTWGYADSATFHSFCQVFDIVADNGTILTTVDGACNGSNPVKSSTNNGDNWSPFMTNLPNNWYPVLGVNPSTGCFFTFNNTLKQPFIYCTSTEVDEINNINTIKVYPNPANNLITVNSNFDIQKVEILDLTGKIIKSIHQSNNPINISELTKGIYFLKIYSNDDVFSKKIIKQ